MKNVVKNILYHFLLTSGSIFLSIAQESEIINNNKPIHINSSYQSIDMLNNTIVFNGQVVIKFNSIDIHADKVIVTRPKNKKGGEIIESYGNPVIFHQLKHNKNSVSGHSIKLRYEVDDGLIILIGNAYLKYFQNSIQGDRISYLMEKQKVQAFSEKGKKVTTIIFPNQFNHENNSKILPYLQKK